MIVNPVVPGSITTCTRCGQFIALVPFGLHYKYVNVTRLAQRVWKCQPTSDYPVRSHKPLEEPRDVPA
jgi:hypothetical protein